jgi:hypothetical protein
LLLAASARRTKTDRIIGYEAAAWLYAFDAFPTLTPAFIVPHGTWRRGPHDHQRRRIDDIEVIEHDIHRQNAILDAGYDLRRFAFRHVTRTPKYVIRETMLGLARAGLDLSKIGLPAA